MIVPIRWGDVLVHDSRIFQRCSDGSPDPRADYPWPGREWNRDGGNDLRHWTSTPDPSMGSITALGWTESPRRTSEFPGLVDGWGSGSALHDGVDHAIR